MLEKQKCDDYSFTAKNEAIKAEVCAMCPTKIIKIG